MKPLVLIPCGNRKSPKRQPAYALYQGGYFKICLRYALSITTKDKVFIVSAKHGLLGLYDEVDPYNLLMGQPGSITADKVREQAIARDIVNEPEVVIVAGSKYAEIAKAVWPHGNWILEGKGGMGYQQQYLTRLMRAK